MKEEIKSAGEFLAKLLWQSQNLSQEKASTFSTVLQTLLCNHYMDHWFPEKPYKGSAYRCLRINTNKMEPLIMAACRFCGFTDSEIDKSLPCELTLWIDPREVSYRIGENGSVCVLYSEDNGNSMDQSDDGDTDSSLGSSPGTSPSKSPVHLQQSRVNNNQHDSSSSISSNNRHRRRHHRTNFQHPSPTSSSSDVHTGCSDPWITNDQSHTNIQKLSAYVYS